MRPNIIGVPRSSVAGCRKRDADDRGDPGTGPPGAPEVLHVVAPDEELLARQPDPLHQLAGDQHAVERDHDVLEAAPRRPPLDVGEACTTRAVAGEPDREAEPVRVVLGDHGRAEEVVRRRGAGAGSQAVRGWDPVVVHQPDQVGAALERRCDPGVEPAGAAGVLGRAEDRQRSSWSADAASASAVPSVEALSTTTTSSGRPARRRASATRPGDQVTTVPGDDDGDDPGAHCWAQASQATLPTGSQAPRSGPPTGLAQQTSERSSAWLAA